MKLVQQSLLIIAGLLLALPAWAQRHPGRHYDPKAVVTVQGQVEKVETISKAGRQTSGADNPWQQKQIVYLKTDQGTMRVHLGPVKFLEQQQFAPKVGDTLSVTGARMTTGRGAVMVAAAVKAGDKTVTLRDAQGNPVWRGQGRKGAPKILEPKAPAPPQ